MQHNSILCSGSGHLSSVLLISQLIFKSQFNSLQNNLILCKTIYSCAAQFNVVQWEHNVDNSQRASQLRSTGLSLRNNKPKLGIIFTVEGGSRRGMKMRRIKFPGFFSLRRIEDQGGEGRRGG